jgi:translocation and assembly module TamA
VAHSPSRETRFALALALAAACWAAAARAGVDVEIQGIDGPERQNVEDRLSIYLQRKDDDLDQATVDSLHARAEHEIGEALQPFGYYQSVVKGTLQGAAPDWSARYEIQLGPPTTLDQVDIAVRGEGAMEPDLQSILDELPMAHGDRLLHQRYDDTKALLGRTAYRRGYLDARFSRALLPVYVDENRADALLTLESGPAYEFGPVTIEAQDLDPELLQRYVDANVVPGDRFDPQKLLDARFALTDLDYFQTVDAVPQREQLDGRRLPVVFKTTPRAPHHYEFGIGYGTDTGARLSGATEFRRLNTHGHKLLLNLQLSEILKSTGAEYRIPVGHRSGETLSFQAGAANEKLADGRDSKYTIGTSLSRIPGKWKRRYYLEFQHETSELGITRQTSDLLIPGVAVNRTELDNPIHARRGWSAFADVHGASRALLANTNFLQAHIQLKGVLPLGARTRLLGRYEYGASLVGQFNELPASQRFFAGGDESVRGYQYQSLGPKDALGNVIGGKFLTTMSVETEYFPWEHWGGAVFYDAGGADDDPSPALSQAVGVGLRYLAPVGYFQVDVAHPLNGDDGGVRLHLGVRVGL